MSVFCRQSTVAFLLATVLVAPAVPCSADDRLSLSIETVLEIERILKHGAVASTC